jgi:hypothetical protein
MNQFGFATCAASGLVVAIFSLAGSAAAVPAADARIALASAAEIAPTRSQHQHKWLDDIQPKVIVPHVDTSVRTRTVTN